MARLQIFRSSLLAAAVAAAFLPVASERADAATLTWDGGGTNNNWSTINNWNPNQLPANFDSLIFAGSVRTSPSNDIDSFFVSSLTFAPGAAAFTLGGSGFATGSFTGTAAFLNLGTNVQTINNPLAFNGATNINNTSGSTGPLTFNGAIQLFGANVTVGGTSVVTFNGALTTSDTSGTLTVNPASTLVLGVANAVPAVYNVAVNGSLRMNGVVQTFANLAGNGFVDLGTATLEVGGGQFSGRISGTGGVTKIGSGGLTLSGFNTYAGPTRVLAGTLSTPSGGALPSGTALDVTGGVLDAGSSNQIVASLHLANGSVAGGGTLRATGDISLESGFASARIGGANLIKSTAGRVTLAAPVLSANSIVVTDGTLELLASNLLPGTDMTVQAPGTVNLGGFSATLRNIAGDGSIALGTGGVLTVGADNQSSAFGGIITGAPNGAGQGGLRKVGNGSLALSAVLQSGGITIDAGTLELPNGVASSGAVLRVNPSGTLLAKGIVNRPIAAAGGSHLSATGDLILGDLTGAGGVSILGTLDAGSHRVQLVNLAGASLGGTVLIGERGQLTAFDQLSGMVLEAGGTLNASGNAFVNGNFVNRGRVNGPGASGSSLVFTDDVSGPGSYGGNVSFLQGFSPGASPAAVSLGNASFAATSTLLMELGGRTSGSQYDQLLVSGLLELQGGLLDVVLIDGFSPHAGDSFDLFDWGSLGGSFGSIHLPSLGSQLAWNTSRLYVDGTLAVAAIPEAEIYAMIAAGLLGIGWRRRRHGPLSTF